MSFFKKYIALGLLFFALKVYSQEYHFKNITVKDGLPSNIVFDIQQDKIGYLWIATEKGLVKFDGDDFTLIHKKKTTTIFVDHETIYAGLENGLFIKNKSKVLFLKSKKVLSIAKHKNEVIIGTIEGIYSLNNNTLRSLKTNSTLDSNAINGIITREKDFLITSSKGLYKINKTLKNNTLKLIELGNFTSISKSYSSCLVTKNNKDILKIKNDSVVEKIETIDGISSLRKLKNEIWVTSKTNGIAVFTLPSFTFKQKINKYNSLQTNQINNTFKSRNHTIWIASNNGIYSVIKNTLKKIPPKTPHVFFENLQINHQNADSLFSDHLKLPNSKNNVAISFKTIDLSNPKKIQYRYQLNDNFSSWSYNNTVQFPNLNTGKYIFNIQSKVENQISNPKSFSFSISPPFYQEAWFVFTVIITILLLSYLALDQYIKRIQKIHKEKIEKLKFQNQLLALEQKALQLQMNPHFIFNVLNGIKALGNNGKTKELNNTISKFSILLRGILNNSRKEEITLQEEIVLLKNYIELEQRMSSNSFSYQIIENLKNIDPEEILIPTMLIQPFVENSIQHAFEKNSLGYINIDFTVKNRFLCCSIIDNGIGIYQSQKKKRNTNHKSVALQVSKERLLAINKYSALQLEEIIKDKKVTGTKVSFKIPLKTDY